MTITKIAFGEYFFACLAMESTIFALRETRSVLDMPAFLWAPAVMTITSEFLVCLKSPVPVTFTSKCFKGEDSAMSKANPFAVEAVLFQMTISPSCCSASIIAVVEPTLPAPQMVIFLLGIVIPAYILFLKVVFKLFKISPYL